MNQNMIAWMTTWWPALQVIPYRLNQKQNPTDWKYKSGSLMESGSDRSILNESVATEIFKNSSLARRLTTAPSKKSKLFQLNPQPSSA